MAGGGGSGVGGRGRLVARSGSGGVGGEAERVVRCVALAAGVRVASLWWCSCLYRVASLRFGGGGARGVAVVVLVSVLWRVASF